MRFEDFLNRLNKCLWGVVSFNTYHSDGEYCFFIMVAQNGPGGRFLKREGPVSDIDTAFVEIIGEF